MPRIPRPRWHSDHVCWTALAPVLFTVAVGGHAAEPPAPPQVPENLDPQVAAVAPGVRIDLVAEHPAIVTPTGIDVDAHGRIWVVACHTHFRPAGYEGPAHDEVLVFDRDGSPRVFASRTTATMNLLLGPALRTTDVNRSRSGVPPPTHPQADWVYLAERSRIIRVRDADGDGTADVEEPVVTLDTVTDYPHNGLAGMAWHPSGDLVFSLGENFGKDWTLTDRDGTTLRGTGEGGVFRCTPDGRRLERIARGFWNPFGITVLADGEIFAVDNDPGSRPPCRLLQVAEGGDYGFQWVYGSSPVHPFVSWNGELRGTLGMIHSVGEGPCAVVPLGGDLLVPSWSQHRIDAFAMTRRGAGYEATRHELVSGGDHFRPTCMARGPDGAFYVADWVFSSYTIHRRGRIWRLTIDEHAPWRTAGWPAPNDAARRAHHLRAYGMAGVRAARADGGPSGQLLATPPTDPQPAAPPASRDELLEAARSDDPLLADAALAALCRAALAAGPDALPALRPEDRTTTLVALRKAGLDDPRWVRAVWDAADTDADLRFECLRWIADGVLTDFAGDVEAVLARSDLDWRSFEAALAAANTLRGEPGAGVTDAKVLAARLADPATPPRIKGFIVRLLPPNHAALAAEGARPLIAIGDPDLTTEVVRSVAAGGLPEAWPVLAEIAADPARPESLRADAIAGLAASGRPEDVDLLVRLASGAPGVVRNEALRSLRGRPPEALPKARLEAIAAAVAAADAASPTADAADLVTALIDPESLRVNRPPLTDTAAWLARLDAVPGPGDPDAGRRIFFHAKLGQCGTCHRHRGRGAVVGPDLTLVGRQTDRAGILRSILEPDRDVAPQYRAHVLQLADGTAFTGILLRSSSVEVYRDLTGRERRFTPEEIDDVTELRTSVMPAGLALTLTDRELRDVLLTAAEPSMAADFTLPGHPWPRQLKLGEGH
jgi:putative membrane-bound dehydrogenase-like protein